MLAGRLHVAHGQRCPSSRARTPAACAARSMLGVVQCSPNGLVNGRPWNPSARRRSSALTTTSKRRGVLGRGRSPRRTSRTRGIHRPARRRCRRDRRSMRQQVCCTHCLRTPRRLDTRSPGDARAPLRKCVRSRVDPGLRVGPVTGRDCDSCIHATGDTGLAHQHGTGRVTIDIEMRVPAKTRCSYGIRRPRKVPRHVVLAPAASHKLERTCAGAADHGADQTVDEEFGHHAYTACSHTIASASSRSRQPRPVYLVVVCPGPLVE